MSGDMIVRGFGGGPFGQNGFVVSCVGSGAAILVDPGATVGEMLAAVAAARLTVEAIVLTHAHIDHVEGVPAAREATSAPIWLHRADEELYQAAPLQAQWFGVQVGTLPPVDRYLEDGDRIEFGECALEVRFTPGHAPGHVTLVGDGVALVGDCVFNGSIGRTDLPGGDLSTLMRSIRERILTLPDETVLYSGHGPETTVGHERVSNPFLVPNFGGSSFA
jgi:glyoxylase-like metal-dependent hydrolase (beta-lactamase superfamily II)